MISNSPRKAKDMAGFHITILMTVLLNLGFHTGAVMSATNQCPAHIQGLRSTYLTTHNRICYLFVNHEVYWKTARDYCLNKGGEMLSIKDEDTMQFIRNTLNSKELSWDRAGVWLGAMYYGRRWRWTDGDLLNYTNWAANEPSKFLGTLSIEDCGQMRADDNWQWHDYPCGGLRYHYNYVCQFRMKAPILTTPSTPVSRLQTYSTTQKVDDPNLIGSPVLSERLRAEILELLRREGVSYNILNSGLSQSALSQPGEVKGRVASSATSQEEDNGYRTILIIIGTLSGTFLLIMLLVFLFLLRHQRNKRAKLEAQVRFTNNAYDNHSLGNAENPPLPAPPSSRPPGVKDDLYLTPRDVTDVYSEISKPEGHLHSLQFRPKPCKCGIIQAENSSLCSSALSSSSLGACGGSDHDLRTPLMSTKTSGDGAKANGACCTCVSPSPADQAEGYIDMQSLTSTKQEVKPVKEKVDEDKHTYTNVEQRAETAENHYEVLP